MKRRDVITLNRSMRSRIYRAASALTRGAAPLLEVNLSVPRDYTGQYALDHLTANARLWEDDVDDIIDSRPLSELRTVEVDEETGEVELDITCTTGLQQRRDVEKVVRVRITAKGIIRVDDERDEKLWATNYR